MNPYEISRRTFLQQLGLITAGTALAACAPTGAGVPAAGGGEAGQSAAVQEIAPGVPRNQCIILENPTGTVLPADDFNRCAQVPIPTPLASNNWL